MDRGALLLEEALTVPLALQAMYKSYGSCRELMELRNLTSVGELILMSALQRRGSCGGHYCVDEPAGAVRSFPLAISLLIAVLWYRSLLWVTAASTSLRERCAPSSEPYPSYWLSGM